MSLVLAALTTIGAVFVIDAALNPTVSFTASVGFQESQVAVSVTLTSRLAFIDGRALDVSPIQFTRADLRNVTLAALSVDLNPVGSPGAGYWLAQFVGNISAPADQNSTVLTPTSLSHDKIPQGQYFVQITMSCVTYRGSCSVPETVPLNATPGNILSVEGPAVGAQAWGTEIGLIVAVAGIAWVEIPQGVEAWNVLWSKRGR